ncbi:hypothetical protein BGZ65_006246, partial [Modicella reniformis]
FTAEFKDLNVGHYVINWRVKLLKGFRIPNGLRFSVAVSYKAEPTDMSGSFDVTLSPEELEELGKGHPQGLDLDLTLEELVVIQPYERKTATQPNEREAAMQPHEWDVAIKLSLSNTESERRLEHLGLQVEFVEIRPFNADKEGKRSELPNKYIVKRAAKAIHENEAAGALSYWTLEPSGERAGIPIARLAWSKDSSFLVALSVKEKSAHITVWDMKSIQKIPEQTGDESVLHPSYATADISQETHHEIFNNLSIGLAISPKGDYVAIYQEPSIGQWKDGSKLDKCLSRIRVFNNPLAGWQKKPESYALDVDEIEQDETKLVPQSIPHRIFDSFIGYGAFLTEKENIHCEKNSLIYDSPCAKVSEVEISSSETKRPVIIMANTLFVACNGMYIDVFKEIPNERWTHIRAIRLTDLVPTLSRRITCKTMMETISSNTFMWLEDDGLCCTPWDLQKGSNVSYIFSTDNARSSASIFRGNCKMAISPDESIVVLARDDTLTTYYANSGIEISTKKYPGHSIEYVGFDGQRSQLFVIVQRSISLKLSSCILDPFNLTSQMKVNRVPVPIVGKTILAFFRDGLFNNKGLVCEADGNKINCYVSSEPDAVKVTKSKDTLANHSSVRNSRLENGFEYELKIGHHEKRFPDGDGSKYWIIGVEVVEESQGSNKVIFSFVSGPWMRVSTMDVSAPDDLMNVYFLPGGIHFVVAGMQTLQIWNFPTDEFDHFHIDFIWSRPRMKGDPYDPFGRAYKSELVGEHYHCVPQPKIYLDGITGNIEADFELRERTVPHHVIIPATGASKTQATFLYCARSIHLLSAAYVYSQHESKKTTTDSSQETITFEAHAEAIARFTLGHINRLLSKKDYNSLRLINGRQDTREPTLKWNVDPPNNPRPTAGPIAATSIARPGALTVRSLSFDEDSQKQPDEIVNILTLLLNYPALRDLNRAFIEGLLKPNSAGWIPHTDKSLNPIANAIMDTDDQLLKILIDYCIQCAKTYHPAYLTPVEQCFAKLQDRHPDIVTDLFRSTSYIPAHNH